MNVNDCPAGPAMDAAVARALGLDVLGIVPCCPDPETFGYLIGYEEQGNVPRPVYLRDCACEFKEPNDVDYFGHHAGCLDVVSDYSTDIAAAWELVTKELSGFELTWDDYEGAVWFCYTGEIARADTAPLAICRAFLKARGVGEVGT